MSQTPSLIEKGYLYIERFFDNDDLCLLESEYNNLIKKSKRIMQEATEKNISLAQYYKENSHEVIVVPEAMDESAVCRFEQIMPNSPAIKAQVIPKLQAIINEKTGSDFVLFKDKCNVKSPGGGAFNPHQDICAYQYFYPKFYMTAAIILDDSTIENGCLEMATNYKQLISEGTPLIKTPFGSLPVFEYYRGGNKNGDIDDTISNHMTWQVMEAKKGDVILFDAYIPHRSKKNNSLNQRRNLFFTFNLESEGNYYKEYYSLKTKSLDNPIFHVSTPTKHNQLQENRYD